MSRRLAVLLISCVLGACTGGRSAAPPEAAAPATPPEATAPPDADDGPRPYEGIWALESGRGPAGEIPIVDNWPITLEIDGRRVSGRSACNSYGGRVTISGSSFDVGGLAGTEIGCAGDVAVAEERYLDALQAAETITRDGDRLSLTGTETELIFHPVAPPPTAQLVGTEWHLETLLEPRGNQRLASSAAPAELKLSRDGTFTGSTGCRRLEGEWIENLNEILFTSMEAIGNCSDDLRAQDGHVVGVLGDGFTAEVEGQELTVVNGRGGAGLVYRAW